MSLSLLSQSSEHVDQCCELSIVMVGTWRQFYDLFLEAMKDSVLATTTATASIIMLKFEILLAQV